MANSSTFHSYFSSLEAFKNHRLCSEIVQRYDIRGVFNQNLTVQDAYVLGHTLTVYFQKQTSVAKPVFIIGHDCRPSSPQLKQALITGIIEVGGSVIDVGLTPTPLVNVCTLKKDIFNLPDSIVAGIVITASHNPAPYNGFKIMDTHGMPLCGDERVTTPAASADGRVAAAGAPVRARSAAGRATSCAAAGARAGVSPPATGTAGAATFSATAAAPSSGGASSATSLLGRADASPEGLGGRAAAPIAPPLALQRAPYYGGAMRFLLSPW